MLRRVGDMSYALTRFVRRWSGRMLALALLVTLVLSALALLNAPQPTSVASAAAHDGLELTLPLGQEPSAWWRLQLRCDPSLVPGPDWLLSDGEAAAAGYALHYHADKRVLRLYRRRPAGRPWLLLRMLACPAAPQLVELRRRGGLLVLVVDQHQRVDCHDPLPGPPARRWRLHNRGSQGDAQLSLHHDRRLERAHERAGTPAIGSVAAARQLLGEHFALPAEERDLPAVHAALAVLKGRERAELEAWEYCLRSREALADDDPFAEVLIAEALERFARAPAGGAGLAADVIPPLSRRVLAPTLSPLPAGEWIARRSHGLQLIESAAYIARGGDEQSALKPGPQHPLTSSKFALVQQVARTLRGAEALPVPTDAPRWSSARWRLLSVADSDPDALTDIPQPWRIGDPAAAALGPLLDAAGFDQPAALRSRSRVMAALAAKRPDEAVAALGDAPDALRPIVAGLLAWEGLMPREQALAALGDGGAEAAARQHPLAWALAQRLQTRASLAAVPGPGEASPLNAELPTTLARFRRLLAGKAASTMLVPSTDPAILPPPQALAAALLMQDLAGLDADWALLRSLPSLRLPLGARRRRVAPTRPPRRKDDAAARPGTRCTHHERPLRSPPPITAPLAPRSIGSSIAMNVLLPTVAIVGRPNVGKSRLFNRLIGESVSIVDPTAGVTRDRVLHEVDRAGLRFDLVDTGGIGVVDSAKLEADVERQVDRAIHAADCIVFLLDGRSGDTALDREIAQRLRPYRERVLVAVNKIDHENLETAVPEFSRLGFGVPLALSAEQNRGIDDLLDGLRRHLPSAADLEQADSAAAAEGRVAVCLAGRRNVGKSSLSNALLGEERLIVADHAGTTRDAIDISVDCEAGRFLLIDTAGLRKKRQLRQDLEFYAACRTERAIRRADVSLLVLDAADEVGSVDKKLASYCENSGKPTVLVINKWDIASEMGADRKQYERWLRDRLPGLRHAPMHCTAAVDGRGVHELLPLARELHEESQQRIPTADCNRLLQAAVQRRRPRKIGRGPTKLYYMTQVDTGPATFVIFVNKVAWVEPGYARYIENFIRERSALKRVPLKILFKERSSRYADDDAPPQASSARSKAERNARLILPKGKGGGRKNVRGPVPSAQGQRGGGRKGGGRRRRP